MRYRIELTIDAYHQPLSTKQATASVNFDYDVKDVGELLEILGKLAKHIAAFDQYAVTKI